MVIRRTLAHARQLGKSLAMENTLMGYELRTEDGRLCTPWMPQEGLGDHVAFRYAAATTERGAADAMEHTAILVEYGTAEQVAADGLRQEFDK